MISKTFNRYIWLLNTVLQQKRITFEEVRKRWDSSYINEGKPLALRTFHLHREAIAELFGVEIVCDKSNYEYYVSSPNLLKSDKTRQWLLNSFTLSNMITAGHNMADRILFEDVPGGTEYMQMVVEAMQRNKELYIEYQSFGGHPISCHFNPYAMKIFNQRWYIVGYLKESGAIRNISLDRVLGMQITSGSFSLPDDFDAKEYYANTVGIFVNSELKPQKVIVRSYGIHTEYLRSLPLHHSQQEIGGIHNDYSDFQYELCLTPELTTKLLSMGEKIEVLEPQELREDVKKKLEKNLKHYIK